jgi:hypothetical protein
MDRVITFTTDYSKINAEAGDVITITNSIYGFVNQPFKIVRVREIESEAGGIAVEITAQEYDATMYTAGGQPRRPRVPSVPIDIPDIAVIGTPAAPTVVQLNNVAVPALDITGLTPAGIVDRFEFWYSTDAGVTYKVLGSRSNSNGSPYNQNTSLTFRAASLPAGSYLFKVRGGNENAFGDFSPASTTVVWAPVQVTDQVTDTTTIGGSMSDLIGPLAMGAVAYFAYQALYPEIMKALGDSALGEIFGIPTSAVQEMKNAAGNFKLIQVGDSIQTPYNNDTITFVAGDGIEITAVADDGIITISGKKATNTTLGVVRPDGTTITVDANGVISAECSCASTGGGGAVDPTTGETLACAAKPLPKPIVSQMAKFNVSLSGYTATDATWNVTNARLGVSGTSFPYKINGVESILTHEYAILATSALKDVVFKGSFANGIVANHTLYDDTAGLISEIKYRSASITSTNTTNTRRIRPYYAMCNYDSTKTLEQQTWTNWFNAAGLNVTHSGIDTNYWGATTWSAGISMLPPLYDLETITPGSPVTYNDSPIRLNSCNLVIFGFAFSENGDNANLPFEIPFNGRTIFAKGLNTLNYVYPGTSGTPTIATWTDAGMSNWVMMRVMQRKVIL